MKIAIEVDSAWIPKGYRYFRIGNPDYGESFIFNGNIYTEDGGSKPALPLIIVVPTEDPK